MSDIASRAHLSPGVSQFPVEWYFDERLFELEKKFIFDAGPGYVGHELMVPELYNYRSTEWTDHSHLLVRQPDGEMSVDVLGGKSNLTDIAAAIGLGQLKHLDEFTAKRRELARAYFDCLDTSSGCVLPVADFAQSNWHMFQILLPLDKMTITRGEFIARMKARDIGVGVHYPAMHLFNVYRKLGYKEDGFPYAEAVGRSIVTLPLFPAMEQADVERVCTAVNEILNETRK